MRGFDDDLRVKLAAEMRKRGIDLRFETTVTIDRTGRAEVRATLSQGSAVGASLIMFATGRAAHTQGIGLGRRV